MAKSYNPDALRELCLALGVDDPATVTRVVVDMQAGSLPMLYVERVGDAAKIVAALREPGIEIRRDDSGASKHVHPVGEKCQPGCRIPVENVQLDAPTVHGSITGNMAWGNGSVVQNSRR